MTLCTSLLQYPASSAHPYFTFSNPLYNLLHTLLNADRHSIGFLKRAISVLTPLSHASPWELFSPPGGPRALVVSDDSRLGCLFPWGSRWEGWASAFHTPLLPQYSHLQLTRIFLKWAHSAALSLGSLWKCLVGGMQLVQGCWPVALGSQGSKDFEESLLLCVTDLSSPGLLPWP